MPPKKGEIILNGKLYKRNLPLSSKLNIGYVSQDLILFEGGLIENITLKKVDQRNHNNNEFKELLSSPRVIAKDLRIKQPSPDL